jgi:sulfatase maturation enzyme AslB (radical SAM superfamily)
MSTPLNILKDVDQVCLSAFKSISIKSNGDSLYVGPCCVVEPGMLTTQGIDFEKHELLEQIRESWKHGEVYSECQRCKQLEAAGLPNAKTGMDSTIKDYYTSGRTPPATSWDDIYKPDLLRMDYWVGDMCNLACVTCGPKNSSLWRQILQYPKSQQKITTNNFWDKVDFSKLLDVHIHGGEPFLSREHVEFIQAIPNKHKVGLAYNTNGTVRPSSQVFEIWQEYNRVNLDFSFDDIGDRFEYLRWPAKWDQALDTFNYILNKIGPNSSINIYIVDSVLNNPYLLEIKDWWKNNYPTDAYNQPIRVEIIPAGGNWGVADLSKDWWLETLDIRDQQYTQGWRDLFPKSINNVLHP